MRIDYHFTFPVKAWQQCCKTVEGKARSILMTKQYSYPKEKIKILLLEGIHPAAVEIFE